MLGTWATRSRTSCGPYRCRRSARVSPARAGRQLVHRHLGGEARQGLTVSSDGAACADHGVRLGPAGQRHHSLLIAPVTLLACERLGVSPAPYLIAEVLASNIGGAATLIRDPPNIIIASRSGLTFNDFLVHMTPIAALAIAVLVLMLPLLFRGSFEGDPDRVADVMGG